MTPRYRPLFCTGLARSGSNLLCRMISAHPEATVAADPYLVLFKSLRNAIVRHRAPADVAARFAPAVPLQDFYFDEDALAVLDAILGADLALPFAPAEWERFIESARARAAYECADLVPHLDRLRAGDYRGMFDAALDIVASARAGTDRRWVGFKDLWTFDLFAPLARAYPEARFIAILRDPRATVASMLAFKTKDPSQVAHTLSYARHWRKTVTLAERFRRDPLFQGRLLVLQYEPFVKEPEAHARALCDFLGVSFVPAMLDPESYFDWSTGKPWAGNSSFEDAGQGIARGRAERWRTALDPRVVKLVDFVCGPEMRVAGYDPAPGAGPSAEALEYVIENDREEFSWRSDLGDPQKDWGYELFRAALLDAGRRGLDARLVRRSFLFEEMYERLLGAPA